MAAAASVDSSFLRATVRAGVCAVALLNQFIIFTDGLANGIISRTVRRKLCVTSPHVTTPTWMMISLPVELYMSNSTFPGQS